MQERQTIRESAIKLVMDYMYDVIKIADEYYQGKATASRTVVAPRLQRQEGGPYQEFQATISKVFGQIQEQIAKSYTTTDTQLIIERILQLTKSIALSCHVGHGTGYGDNVVAMSSEVMQIFRRGIDVTQERLGVRSAGRPDLAQQAIETDTKNSRSKSCYRYLGPREQGATGVHAEMRLLGLVIAGIVQDVVKFQDQDNIPKTPKYYVGISQECCDSCKTVMDIVNEALKEVLAPLTGENVIGFRGGHGGVFPSSPPNFLGVDTDVAVSRLCSSPSVSQITEDVQGMVKGKLREVIVAISGKLCERIRSTSGAGAGTSITREGVGERHQQPQSISEWFGREASRERQRTPPIHIPKPGAHTYADIRNVFKSKEEIQRTNQDAEALWTGMVDRGRGGDSLGRGRT
ncbi:hypothetical protein EDM53_00245 [Rickettsiales endosymbiont of Peranema trichophorum]|uniref:hypothetical protein n=1 Tax=Rickettsiales endosymbiont of Peranema trichophorum TaxID=2486577 RepID=UPI001022B6B6|nr:hypothetical protein [Rickettsiales endosymbiont of Peranema trichophorum]RZI47765.1 hypothetical protein EDM53_00245 [Rickettsiales endosymbiont of Peranema trichophorum]